MYINIIIIFVVKKFGRFILLSQVARGTPKLPMSRTADKQDYRISVFPERYFYQ